MVEELGVVEEEAGATEEGEEEAEATAGVKMDGEETVGVAGGAAVVGENKSRRTRSFRVRLKSGFYQFLFKFFVFVSR